MMIKKVLILITFLCYSASSQSLSVFDIDTSAFPIMKAKFYACDKDGKQIKTLSPSDFKLTENGTDRTVLSVICQPDKVPERISSTIVIDVSGSMSGSPLLIAKTVAKTWVNAMPLGQSNCAVTSFDNGNYFNQDFTTNRNKLISAIDAVGHGGGTDYNMALIEPVAGGILVAKTAKYKKVIIFITDGQPNQNPDETRIINEAKANGITINCISINLPAHPSMKHFAEQTGGLWFENVKTEQEAKKIAELILNMSLYNTLCEISWESGFACFPVITNFKLLITNVGLIAYASYQAPKSSVAKLEFNPSTLMFSDPTPGVTSKEKVIVTARNADFTVTNSIISNPAFNINPKSFLLKSGGSIELSVSYFPLDSGYNYCQFKIENGTCPTNYLVSGGWEGKNPSQRSIKLIHPNGGEVFPVGIDTVITWEGVLPDENVRIEYSTDNGLSWFLVADSYNNFIYKWHIPNTPSNQCIARVTARSAEVQSDCANGDVQICNQIWMGCNLDVDTYRNGDPIPEVTDSVQWTKLTTGAWCYYNNDPANGAIYGKLYNWYAVNDPRGLAPVGWHIPTDAEWTELENCLGGRLIAGGKLKSTGTKEAGTGLWISPNTGATNESVFSAHPGGFSDDLGGACHKIGSIGYWWSATEKYVGTLGQSWFRYISFAGGTIVRVNAYKKAGFSVRCLWDK